ncbi:hypothetical protein NKJ02_26570 [Mesorhizobium sp. M0213]
MLRGEAHSTAARGAFVTAAREADILPGDWWMPGARARLFQEYLPTDIRCSLWCRMTADRSLPTRQTSTPREPFAVTSCKRTSHCP